MLWHEKSNTISYTATLPIRYHNYKNGENWAGGGGTTDKSIMDSLLGSLSIIKVFRLVARNKHFSATDFTDFLKILFSLTSKIYFVHNLTFLD